MKRTRSRRSGRGRRIGVGGEGGKRPGELRRVLPGVPPLSQPPGPANGASRMGRQLQVDTAAGRGGAVALV